MSVRLSVIYSTKVCGIFHKLLWNTPGFKLQAFQQYKHILYSFTKLKPIDKTCIAALQTLFAWIKECTQFIIF